MEDNDKSVIDALLDDDNHDNIVLYGDDDDAIEFVQIAIIPHEDKIYAILQPAVMPDCMDDDEALLFRIDKCNDTHILSLVMDGQTIDIIFDKYERLYKKLKEEVDDE